MKQPDLPPPPSTPSTHLDLVELAAALVAWLGAGTAIGNLFRLSGEAGTSGWQQAAGAVGLCAAGYLLLSGLEHLARGRQGQPVSHAEPWLSLLVLVLGWFVLAQGPESRLLLAGLAPTIASLAANAGVSVLVWVRARVVLQRPAQRSPRPAVLAPWRCLLAACVLVSVLYLETRPLPEIKPWEDQPAAVTP
jgi:hypothetical protein